jgi:hypothetical protein
MEDWQAYTLMLAPAFVAGVSHRCARWRISYPIAGVAGIVVAVSAVLMVSGDVDILTRVILFISGLVVASFSVGRMVRFGLANAFVPDPPSNTDRPR